MSVIIDPNGSITHCSANLRGLRDYARVSPVIGVEVRDTDGRLAELDAKLDPRERPYRRYEYLVHYSNGCIGRDFFADWRIACDFTYNRRS